MKANPRSLRLAPFTETAIVIRLILAVCVFIGTTSGSRAQKLSQISVSPASVEGGTSSTGTVTLGSPAPTKGIKVLLGSNSPCALVPASVTIPKGAVSGTFGIATRSAANAIKATLKASLGSVSKTATLTVLPITLVGLTFDPASVVGGTSATGVVALSGTAPVRTVVSLSSSSLSATAPTMVIFPAGSSKASFSVTTTSVTKPVTATVSATLGSVTQSATLSINVLDPILDVTSSVAVMGGNSNWAYVSLVAPAGPSGVVVFLTSSDRSASVPPKITIGPGLSRAEFGIVTSVVWKPTTVTVTASADGSSQSTKFVIDPPFQIAVAPEEIVGGNTATGTVTLAGPAPAGGLTFALSTESDGALITAPPSVTIPAGSKSASFSVDSSAPTWDGTNEMIRATNSDGLYSYTYVTLDKELKLTSVVLLPNSVSGGASTCVQVTVNEVAPVGGYVVQLTASAPSLARVPASVTIPAGANSAVATVATASVSSFQSSVITATFGGSTMGTTLWVTKALPGTTYVLLNPDSWGTSRAGAVSAKNQGGYVDAVTNSGNVLVQHAAFWSGTKSSFVDLHPSSWTGSYVAGLSGNLQVGNVYQIQGGGHAALWNGTASSFLDLNPPGSASSSANAISGTTIVGYATFAGGQHAALWAGSASNVIDLNPIYAGPSNATATDGKSTVGYIGAGAIIASSAALWTGQTPDSYVNLSPTGWSASSALGVSGNNQVGWVGNLTWISGFGMPYPEITGPFAARWSGTSGSYVSLDVPGDIFSTAYAISGNVAVGYVQCPGQYGVHAALWLDTASSFIDLMALAGANWANSSANAIYSDSTGIYVAGWCDAGAIVWHIPTSDLPKLLGTQYQKPSSPILP